MNAARTGPAGDIAYRFDVATDPAFSMVLIGAMVAETTTQTSFTPPSDLPSGTDFYWRARAVDVVTDVTSEYSATQNFRTWRSVASGSYQLEFHYAASCNAPSFVFRFNGNLRTDANALRFTADCCAKTSPGWSIGPLVFELKRDGDRLSGSALGSSTSYAVHPGQMVTLSKAYKSLEPASVSGVVSADSRLTGELDGTVDCVYISYSIGCGCTAPRHTWALAPR
jgi:hypothetical protein